MNTYLKTSFHRAYQFSATSCVTFGSLHRFGDNEYRQ